MDKENKCSITKSEYLKCSEKERSKCKTKLKELLVCISQTK